MDQLQLLKLLLVLYKIIQEQWLWEPVFRQRLVQTILPLNNGTAIKLTTARYFTPKGRSIQAKGITPDIVVSQATIQEDDESKFQVSEKDLSRALDTDKPSDNRSNQLMIQQIMLITNQFNQTQLLIQTTIN